MCMSAMAGNIKFKCQRVHVCLLCTHTSSVGSSLHLNNIFHAPHMSKHLLLVFFCLVSDNDVFIEFHRCDSFFRIRPQGKFFFMDEVMVHYELFFLGEL
jgi:hypothetical protein